MKSAADPYEFFRWKSSCGRLAVRTTWVKGVRHVVLSDDDDEEAKRRPRTREGSCNNYKTPAPSRPPLSEVDENLHDPSSSSSSSSTSWCGYNHNNGGGGGDESYVERVLQWLHKPSGMLDARRKPMSAPGRGGRGGGGGGVRRPALVKTCSIPEHKFTGGRTQAAGAGRERPAKSVARNCCADVHNGHGHKTELHVHMPSVVAANDHDHDKDVNYE